MRRSYETVGKYQGRNLKDTFAAEAMSIASIQTDDMDCSLGYVLPISKNAKHVRLAFCTDAAKHRWEVRDIFKGRIVQHQGLIH